MRKVILVILVLLVVILACVVFYYLHVNKTKQPIDNDSSGTEIILPPSGVNEIFVLQIPEIDMYKNDYKSTRLLEYKSRFVKVDEKEYLEVINESPDEYAFNSFQVSKEESQLNPKPPDNRLIVTKKNNGNEISIEGSIYFNTGAFLTIKLTGNWNKKFAWSGDGIVSLGAYFEQPEEFFEIYKIRWRLCTVNNSNLAANELYEVKLTRPFPNPDPKNRPQSPTDEEIIAMQEREDYLCKIRPLIDLELIKYIVRRTPPEQFSDNVILNSVSNAIRGSYSGDDKYEKGREGYIYLRDTILTDIDWGEILFVPGSFFILDYLLKIENETDRIQIGIRHCRMDDSWEPIAKYDLNKLTKIPLLFLLVYYNDWLTEKRVAELSKVSNRIRLIIAEVKKHGNDSPNKLDEIMISVLSKLSDQERRDYFIKSIKLRNYVKESNNLSLQKLMPNDLPPPPGPPENMRDWYNSEGKLRRGAFVRLEDDPDRGKVLILLDEDRIELILGFDEMSKETQRYINEMLEAQAEDAAEAEKNKKQ